ncbi:hypothetical protein HQK29_14350 [Vibrio vulnificus]|nr:hypothetical protein [Vibrio vulnificus]HAS6343422.1 hypothetical protein [Vibrio vulnificus]
MEQTTNSVSKTKTFPIPLPNIIAALPPLLILLGSLVFPFIVNEPFVLYFSDMFPAWLFVLTFLPAVIIYALGQKKRFAILSYVIGIVVFSGLFIEHITHPEQSILREHVVANFEAKEKNYRRLYRHSPMIKMTLFDERKGLGFYIAGLGLLLLPVSLIAPKYKPQPSLLSRKRT